MTTPHRRPGTTAPGPLTQRFMKPEADDHEPLRAEWLASGLLRKNDGSNFDFVIRAQLIAAGVLRPGRWR